MSERMVIEPRLLEALAKVSEYIRKVTGKEATQSEIADALTRYFVLNEIKDHIVMLRENDSELGEDV